ncbi:hypothetical protein HDC90_004468 [Pedobacter sp. AK013]|nr:hypothetical protein [Pedobacter sp. AK013]
MEEINLKVNQKGVEFYDKWLKETKSGIFLYAPVFLLFYLGIGLAIYGLNLKFILISILPVFLILISFVSPYYSRKKYFNQMAKSISINDDVVLIETCEWFGTSSVVKSFPINEIIISNSESISFFKELKVYSLKINPEDTVPIYIIDEFFDNTIVLLSRLKYHRSSS